MSVAQLYTKIKVISAYNVIKLEVFYSRVLRYICIL